MQALELMEAVKKKLDIHDHQELASALGISEQTLGLWAKNNTTLSATQVANAISKSRHAAIQESQHYMIQPIVEFYPIDKHLAKGEVNWEVLCTKGDEKKYHQGIKDELLASYGIYVFYDSSGKALYAGKARKQTLWKEINSAFNRERDVQNIELTNHPQANKAFKAGYEHLRVITAKNLKLHEMAHYFSAYHVEDGFIDNLEALLIRAFANNLMNVKKEKFTNTR